jgi:NitT/TauT family transport system permease protein
MQTEPAVANEPGNSTQPVARRQAPVITEEYLEEKETHAAAVRARRERVGHGFARLLALAAVIGLWEGIAVRHDATLLPTPAQTYAGLVRGWSLIKIAALDTTTEIALGFGIAVIAGVVLGALIGESRIMQGVLHPYMILYQAIPKTGLAPMIVLLLGFGLLPKVTLAAMAAVFPIMENAILGVQRVDEDSLRLFRSLGASRVQIFFKLRLVSALPYLLTGARVGLMLAVVSVVVAEFVAGRVGLGAVMMVGYAQLDTPLVFGALLVLTLVAVGYYLLALLVETLVLRWFNLAHPTD